MDTEKAYTVQFAFDESTLQGRPFATQVAFLCTTTSSERKKFG